MRAFFAAPENSDPETPPEGTLSSWLFLRLLGLVFLIAFLSLWPQILGLIGSRGMLPAAPFLQAVKAQVGGARFYLLPTLFHFGASDFALRFLCGLGIFSSLLLVLGVLELFALLFCWASYLSFMHAGRDFLSFQWDSLLVETAIFSLPLLFFRPGLRTRARSVPLSARLLLWILLARFMFAAGFAKIRSGDPVWRDLSALDYHFFTQPLPTVIGYYAHQLPASMKAAATLLMFSIELGVPLFIFIPFTRRYSFLLFVSLQLVIAATGNYGFFNLLAIVLCIPLLPDAWLRRGLPRRMEDAIKPQAPTKKSRFSIALQATVFVILCALSLLQVRLMFARRAELSNLARVILRKTAPFALVNHYGLFANMTRERPEIVLEGSRDGVTWIPYEFKYKATRLSRRPPWNAPHQPRLDWQMWFAALGSAEESPWFSGLCIRILQGSPDVMGLLGADPFNGKPPQYIRATLWRYFFTTLAEKRQTGAYFRRENPEPFMRPASLDGQ